MPEICLGSGKNVVSDEKVTPPGFPRAKFPRICGISLEGEGVLELRVFAIFNVLCLLVTFNCSAGFAGSSGLEMRRNPCPGVWGELHAVPS